jgi:hypothetical protein
MNYKENKSTVEPKRVLLQREHKDKYGSVPGLHDDELLGPVELERMVSKQEWGPILALPVLGRKGWKPFCVDQTGGVDFGAFDTVDFSRTMPTFDKARYKADKVKEKIKDLTILFSIVNARIHRRDKYRILTQVNKGVIELKHITNPDMESLARLFLRIQRMRQEYTQLLEASMKRQLQRAEAFWNRL